MQPQGLIDTSALIALLDRGDRWHTTCVEAYRSLPTPLATSAAVLTEFFHILDPHPGQLNAAWTTLSTGAISILPITNEDMPELETLMKKYADRPMDFADATLVHLARREGLDLVFTLDFSDFETFRISGNKPFQIVPDKA